MKVYRNNALYVQKEDVKYVKELGSKSFIREFIKDRNIDLDTVNRYDFIKCKNPKERIFFEFQDYILDYDDYKDLSLTDLTKISENMNKSYNNILNDLERDNISKEELLDARSELIKIECSYSSIENMILRKKGTLKFNIPGEESKIGRKKMIKILSK